MYMRVGRTASSDDHYLSAVRSTSSDDYYLSAVKSASLFTLNREEIIMIQSRAAAALVSRSGITVIGGYGSGVYVASAEIKDGNAIYMHTRSWHTRCQHQINFKENTYSLKTDKQ